jgi:glucan phosphoethanolaminetransferase (alkaline phosphatase superfamily)
MLARRWIVGLGADLLIFCGLPGLFLLAYVQHFAAPGESVLAHLRVVAMVVLSLIVVRLVIARLLREAAPRDIAAALAISGVLVLWVTYYALVLVGLQFWGRVISWDLIATYSIQVWHLLEVLEIAPFTAFALLASFCGALMLAAWLYTRFLDWTATGAHRMSPLIFASTVVGGGLFVATELYNFLGFPPTAEAEPVSLTLFPLASSQNRQGHFINALSASRQDRTEDAARAAYVPRRDADRKNVILIVVDALRPDHMGVYGYARDTTPFLSQLAAEGRLSKVAAGMRATCSSSACGLASLLTSKFAHQYSHRAFSLQEVLKRHDYAIHMILGGDHTHFYGLREAYGGVADSYYDTVVDAVKHEPNWMSQRFFGYVNDDRLVVRRLSEFSPWNGTPVMMHFHLMSAHLLGKRWKQDREYQPAAAYGRPDRREPAARGQLGGLTANHYDNGVLQTDAVIRDLLQILDGKGYLRRAIVVITADHGEGLGEHGIYQHAQGVYEELLNVPFIVVSFGYKPDRSFDRARGASQVDIAPTILAELGMPRPASWVGKPVHDGLQRDFTHFQERTLVGLVDHRDPGNEWKYWIDVARGNEFAFNLSADPGETINLVREVPHDLRRDWRVKAMAGAPIAVESKPVIAPESRQSSKASPQIESVGTGFATK